MQFNLLTMELLNHCNENKRRILPKDFLFNCNDIKRLHLTESILYDSLHTTNMALCLFVRFRLLSNTMSCPKCFSAMILKTDKSVVDGKRWRCCNCNKQLSVRHTSFFQVVDCHYRF